MPEADPAPFAMQGHWDAGLSYLEVRSSMCYSL
jgi:hypothetical protein